MTTPHDSASSPVVRVLHIEDLPDHAALVQLLVDGTGRRVRLEGVPTLAAALFELQVGDYQGVLIDLGLPDADGLNAVIAVAEAHPELPLVVLSSRGDRELREAALDSFATAYFVKPLADPDALVDALLTAPKTARPGQGHFSADDLDLLR